VYVCPSVLSAVPVVPFEGLSEGTHKVTVALVVGTSEMGSTLGRYTVGVCVCTGVCSTVDQAIAMDQSQVVDIV